MTKALFSLCLEESKQQADKEGPPAESYCVDCKYNQCEECCSEHRKSKATKNHKLIPIREYESAQNVLSDLATMICNEHERRILDVFCADCKLVVCAMCFIEVHINHKGFYVNIMCRWFSEEDTKHY